MSNSHVHKLLGYGITNIQTNGKQFTDPRLNPEGFTFCEDQEDEYHLRHFFNELVKNQRLWYVELFAMEFYQPYIYDCVHLLPENGIIAIVPPDKSELWHRRDDIIDAVVEMEFFNKETNCAKLENNIPPFTDFMNTKTGTLLDFSEVEIYREKYKRLHNDKNTLKARKQLTTSVTESAKRLGFNDMLDAQKWMAPAVPGIVVAMIHWLKLFAQPETILDMRPVSLSYWD